MENEKYFYPIHEGKENKPRTYQGHFNDRYFGDTEAALASKKKKLSKSENTSLNTHESKETMENTFFINEQTLKETLGKIDRVSKEKRKIIVYAGVHPHEGTAELTKKYADEWSKKYGVLVVCHPTGETPNAIWETHRVNSSKDVVPSLPKNIELSEDKYEDNFSLGEETFFICFHGSNGTTVYIAKDGSIVDGSDKLLPKIKLYTAKDGRKLQVFTSMYRDSPKAYASGNPPLRYGKPEIVEGLDKILPDVSRLGYYLPGNVVLVEYFYEGTPVKIDDPYIEKLLELNKKRSQYGVPLIFEGDDENWSRKRNIRPDFLVQPRLSEEDIKDFHDNFVQQFERLLEHIAQKIER